MLGRPAARWLGRTGLPAASNFLSRATGWGTKFKGPSLPGAAELGLYGADAFGLIPSQLQPLTNAYMFYRSPKFMAASSAIEGLAGAASGPGEGGAGTPGGMIEGNMSPGPLMSGASPSVPGATWDSMLPRGGPGFSMPSPSSMPQTTYSMFG